MDATHSVQQKPAGKAVTSGGQRRILHQSWHALCGDWCGAVFRDPRRTDKWRRRDGPNMIYSTDAALIDR